MADPIKLISLTDPISGFVPIDMALSMAKATKPQAKSDTVATMRAFADRIGDSEMSDRLTKSEKLFTKDGNLSAAFRKDAKEAITGAIGNKFYSFKGEDGKEYTVVGTGTEKEFTIKAIVPSDGLPKDRDSGLKAYSENPGFILETLGKLQLAPKTAESKSIDLSKTEDLQKAAKEMLKADPVKKFTPVARTTASPPPPPPEKAATPSPPAPAKDDAPDEPAVENSDDDGIEDDSVGSDGAAPKGPAQQPKVGAGTVTLPGRTGLLKKFLNPGAGIGAAIGGLLGFFGLGPLGAFIGALLGGLGGSMITGNSPFEDKQKVLVEPKDGRVQVRTEQGEAPVVEMEMEGPPGYKLHVRGKANATGQFEISEAYSQPKVKGGQAQRFQFPNGPPKVPMSTDGFVNKDDIYKAFNYKPEPPTPEAGPDAPAKDAAQKDTKSVDVSIKGVKIKDKTYDSKEPLKKDDVVTIAVETGSGADKHTFELKGIVIDDPSKQKNPRFIITEMKDTKFGKTTKLSEANPTTVSNPGLILRETDLKDYALGNKSEKLLITALTQDQDEHKNPFQEVFKKPLAISPKGPDPLRGNLGGFSPKPVGKQGGSERTGDAPPNR